MARANRIFCRGYVWHLTHRCHQKTFLLKFARDRRRWRHWLFEATRRYGLCVLNYVATSNHIHLLVVDQGNQEIAASMQLVAGRTAQEYNGRKNRKGAFWEDRYHATAVQTDQHLIRCLTYIDLNMVRARAVSHPGEWDVAGYHEIQRPRLRKGIVDHKALCDIVGVSTTKKLKLAHDRWTDSSLKQTTRDALWTESVAVGDVRFLEKLKSQLGPRAQHKKLRFTDSGNCLAEAASFYVPILGSE